VLINLSTFNFEGISSTALPPEASTLPEAVAGTYLQPAYASKYCVAVTNINEAAWHAGISGWKMGPCTLDLS
jgi:hypothetical protein